MAAAEELDVKLVALAIKNKNRSTIALAGKNNALPIDGLGF